ncbi:hypothetical protein JTE90_023984 [Oedothorax gibbosus]|uniref:Uncharacterized protein n=1 Tax=Oedothorax gibbosus TaxID=931172 RepID=A0AAV6UIF5_9ARAC|nr:hypothetical protein JTE90_023984 [Oedothorax gibbosus]
MDSVLRRILLQFPQPIIKTLFKCINSASDSDSIAFCLVLCVLKRLFLIVSCSVLAIYTAFVHLLGDLFGRTLLRYEVVPFIVYERPQYKEDPGVTEMRALLRGEDCIGYHLHQSQRRPSAPAHFNPYNELYLVTFYTRTMALILNLVESVKEQDGFFSQILNGFFTRFDEKLVTYLKSREIINRRD